MIMCTCKLHNICIAPPAQKIGQKHLACFGFIIAFFWQAAQDTESKGIRKIAPNLSYS